jgi:putative hydrolase of the HAD superfamily
LKGGEKLTISPPITSLFLDIGGVLLTNGWDHNARQRAAQAFHLDLEELNERHHLTFDTYEEGKLSLDDYLQRAIFFEKKPFSVDEFKDFMFAQSKPYPKMIELVHELKTRYGLKVVAVSNEGRELTIYRIQKFELGKIIDFFVSSCFVHFRKPDPDIYQIALDIAQVPPKQVVYIDDRQMFIDVARSMGIQGIHHTSYETTRETLEGLGASIDEHMSNQILRNKLEGSSGHSHR